MKFKNCLIAFDLDDTLISEKDYFYSGISAVENFISKTYNVDFEKKILNAHKEGIEDIWHWCCKELNLSKDVKDNFLWKYRLHNPKISMPREVSYLLKNLIDFGAEVVIITDGRSSTQRLKVNSINLQNIPLFISEEYYSEKPELKRYLEVEKIWPKKNYFYIADNPKKDFIGPNKLKWISIGATWITHRVHSYNLNSLKKNQMPKYWLDDPNMVINIIENHMLN